MKNLLIPLLFIAFFKTEAQSFEWAKQMGGTGADKSYSIALDASGNIYTTGYFNGTVDFDPGIGVFNLTSTGTDNIFISKLDPSGNFIWAKQIGGTDYDYGISITVDASGNVYTTGRFYATADFDPGLGTFNLTSAGDFDIFISKLDSSGNFLWAKQMGGTGADYGNSITVDTYGDVYTTGGFYDTADFDPGAGTFNLTSSGNLDIFISKLDSSGNFIWAKRMGGSGEEYGHSIFADISGNVFTTGHFVLAADFDPGAGTFLLNAGNQGYSDMFISKLDSSGNFLWAKQMGGTGNEVGTSIKLDAMGNVYTTGSFQGTADFDPGAGTFNLIASVSDEIFISKLDPSGNFLWAKQMGSTGNDFGYSIALDVSGNVYTSGAFGATADFDPGAGTFNLTSAGSYDIFISKLDSLGNFVWAIRMGGLNSDYGRSLTVDASENVYTTGEFFDTADFDPGVGIFNLTSAGHSDIYVSKLRNTSTSITENDFGNNFKLYPNPADEYTVISAPFKAGDELTVTDVLGKILFRKTVESPTSKFQLQTSNFVRGIYFVKVGNASAKLVKL